MKKSFLFFILLHFFTCISAQFTDSLSLQSQELFLKANKQESTGWILLGGGAGLAAVGLLVGSVSIWDEIIEGDDTGTTMGEVMMITGLVSMVSSIPVFIASGNNRKKAAALVFIKIENSTYIHQYTKAEKKYPAVALSVRF